MTSDTHTVKPSGDTFMILTPSGNVHSIVATLAEAEALSRKLTQADTQHRRECGSY